MKMEIYLLGTWISKYGSEGDRFGSDLKKSQQFYNYILFFWSNLTEMLGLDKPFVNTIQGISMTTTNTTSIKDILRVFRIEVGAQQHFFFLSYFLGSGGSSADSKLLFELEELSKGSRKPDSIKNYYRYKFEFQYPLFR